MAATATPFRLGAPVLPGFQLPTLDTVREEATTVSRYRAGGRGPPPVLISALPPLNGVAYTDEDRAPECLAWKIFVPALVSYSLLVHEDHVPRDLREQVVFTLGMFHEILTTCSQAQIALVLPPTSGPRELKSAVEKTTSYCRSKLAKMLLDPEVDRPDEALVYLRMVIDSHEELAKKERTDPWRSRPDLYVAYGDALVFSAQFNEETKRVLETLVEKIPKVPASYGRPLRPHVVKARIHLAQVLLQMGAEPEAQQTHAAWAAKYLRKHATEFADDMLAQVLCRTNQPPHPVLDALGGADWFSGRKVTLRVQERGVQRCAVCRGAEPIKKLFRCSGCKYIFYCSRECQKADWRSHNDRAKENSRIEEQRATDPQAAQLATEFVRWCHAPLDATHHFVVHALGVHADPTRGRTHIVVSHLEYTPDASKDLRRRFRVAYCGVFRIAEALGDLEAAMGLHTGEGREYIDGLVKNHAPDEVSLLSCTKVEGAPGWLNSGVISRRRLETLEYDPEWRKNVNRTGAAAEPLLLPSGARDAEHIF